VTLLRTGWRRLTAMRTALILLFLLALAAVPGSILPQRPLNPGKTSAYIAAHGGWGRFLDHLGMFDVFGSPWFAAVYLLLFVSLAGCLVPRIRMHARALVRKPLPAPRNLTKLPESGTLTTSASPAEYAAAARKALGRRWRIVERTEPSGALTVSAEKGYSRETGNLVFHVALLVSLVLVVVGRLWSYQISQIVVQGQGFCNSAVVADSWKPGYLAARGDVKPAPFCIDSLDKFTATYSASGEPTKFAAEVTYSRSVNSPVTEHHTITVNHPLRLEGDRVYLIGHGFAPQITVTLPDGTVIHDTAPFIPQNASTLMSEGAFKEPGKPDAKSDVGIEGFFAPTPLDEGGGVITSSSPQVNNPVLGIFVYIGQLNPNAVPQSVYSLDKTHMTKIGAANMQVGDTRTFPNGVKVTFDGWLPWVSMQVSHDPSQGWLLLSAVAMVLGLLGSLGVRRRRVWLRISPSEPSLTLVSVGGLARSDSGNFTAEFEAILERLRAAAPQAAPVDQNDPVAAGKE
jgi:cytochrome c biogenesis protein